MNNFFMTLLLISLLCTFIFFIQVLINLVKKRPAKKSSIRTGISTIIFIFSFIGFGFTSETLTTNNNNSESTTEISPVDNFESTTAELGSQNITDLFKEVYLPYANREKSSDFDSVKQFVQTTPYEIEIIEPSSENVGTITLTATNGDYVYFNFKSMDNIEVIMLVSYFQFSSNSEVSLSNYRGDNSFQYDKYTTHVLGEPNINVNNTQDQTLFLFNK